MLATVEQAREYLSNQKIEYKFSSACNNLYRTIYAFISFIQINEPDRMHELSSMDEPFRDFQRTFSGVWVKGNLENSEANARIFLGLEKPDVPSKLIGMIVRKSQIPKHALVVTQVTLPEGTFTKKHILSLKQQPGDRIRSWSDKSNWDNVQPSKAGLEYILQLHKDIIQATASVPCSHPLGTNTGGVSSG